MKVTEGCGKQSCSGVEIESQFPGLALGNDLNEVIGQVAIGLEKRSGADPVGCLFESDK